MEYTGFRPQSQDEESPALSLDQLLIRNKNLAFFARMQGHAMNRAGIRHGDVLVIEPAEEYRSGCIVLAYINHQALVRRLERTASGGHLVAANPGYPQW